jgi:DNA-directed RNA polymerase subunit RPC12/RpoP
MKKKLMEEKYIIHPIFIINLGDCTSKYKCEECGDVFIVHHDRGVFDNNDAPNYCKKCGNKFNWEMD